jgi:ribonuclease HI
MDLTIFTDGGSLNNPGKAASAYLIYQGKTLLHKDAKYLGIASNNVAEYTALILALQKVKELTLQNKIASVTCYADSKLMVSQLTGAYKIKHPDMKRLAAQIKLLEMEIGIVPAYRHVMRENNTEADALVKSILEA